MKPLLASLRSRVFAATAAVAVLPVAVALTFATRQLGRQADSGVVRGTEESARLVEQYHRTRLELAAERAALVADLPKLKAAVAEADPRTVEPVARDYRERVRADVFVVADRKGRTLVALGTHERSWTGPFDAVRFRVDGERMLETVGIPIEIGAEAPETLGHLTLGFALDDDLVSRLRALTGSEVAIAQGERVFASTLPRRFDAALLAAGSGPGARLRVDGEEYVARRAALGPDPRAPFALVLRSRAEALRPLRTLRAALVLAALVAIAVGVLLSWAVARTVTRPLAALTDAMRDITATGDLARRIPPSQPWDDEDARLLSGAFSALADSVVRFQREAATRDRLSALGRLSTVVAHEVRNPLMIIKGSLRVLKADRVSRDDAREAVADIAREVERLNRIVADVLDFARPLRIEQAPVDVSALAREAAGAALGTGSAVPARFALNAPGTIETDGERLRTVLVNLIENARDSVMARRAGVPADAGIDAIEIGTCAVGSGGVLLWVEDRGLGITKADLAHVFEPYFTTKRTGTGLGLAIARKVVEALGGTIRLASREGEGTRIEIELPQALGPAAKEAR
jgi:signal transduction histidine kinase